MIATCSFVAPGGTLAEISKSVPPSTASVRRPIRPLDLVALDAISVHQKLRQRALVRKAFRIARARPCSSGVAAPGAPGGDGLDARTESTSNWSLASCASKTVNPSAIRIVRVPKFLVGHLCRLSSSVQPPQALHAF